MIDAGLRDLERVAARDDAQARASLIVHRARAGRCPWCGEAGAVHAFVSPAGIDYSATCCCAPCFAQHSRDGLCGECPGARLQPAS